ncbi:mitogen-activated protein kinase kinase kinase kinase 4 [Drosophila hydei]|uniref:Mitogen-activated protein kinase kinase kinase kinase 4 n=1 Tax=Drosophila hydei TaxID=7224 RepID=A0A6J1LVL4_DROHY|nr:mitogen-activated protein kinase kinase kinase kinase 4 [Drosophila hydei]
MERPTSSAMQMIYAELAAVKAQNARLEEENILLRHRLNRASTDQHTNATVNVEAKIRAFQLEEERDRMVETLQMHKKKYNKLQDAYLDKMKRCKALEEMFKRQKTLTGLVMKSALAQRQSEQQIMLEKRQSQQSKSSSAEVEQLQAKLAKMQTALDESYDIIDEMDFELESVDLLEMQNKSLREELAALRTQLDEGAAQVPSAVPADDDDPPPKYEPTDQARRSYRQHVASSTCDCCLKNDDADAESLERAAMTHSLVQTIEAESNCLRRELLRSRLQHKIRAKLDKEEEEED